MGIPNITATVDYISFMRNSVLLMYLFQGTETQEI